MWKGRCGKQGRYLEMGHIYGSPIFLNSLKTTFISLQIFLHQHPNNIFKTIFLLKSPRKPVEYFKETEGGRSQLCKTMEERIDKERIETLFDVVKNLNRNCNAYKSNELSP